MKLSTVDLGTTHPERLDAGPLDEIEYLVAVLFSHGVAQNGAEEPDVLAHRLGRLTPDLGALHGTDWRQ